MRTKLDNFTDEDFIAIIKDSTSMREAQKRFGYYGSGSNSKVIKNRCEELGITTEHFTGVAKNNIKRTEDNIFIKDSTANQTTLRTWYLKGNYTEYKCSICGQEPFWNGKELTLTLDHINGINNDDRLENLRWVCPNCDRQLDTFCSKNISHKKYNAREKNYCVDCGKEICYEATRCNECQGKKLRKIERPNKEQLYELLKNNSFVKVGQMYNVSDNTIRKWCIAYGMSNHSKDYK